MLYWGAASVCGVRAIGALPVPVAPIVQGWCQCPQRVWARALSASPLQLALYCTVPDRTALYCSPPSPSHSCCFTVLHVTELHVTALLTSLSAQHATGGVRCGQHTRDLPCSPAVTICLPGDLKLNHITLVQRHKHHLQPATDQQLQHMPLKRVHFCACLHHDLAMVRCVLFAVEPRGPDVAQRASQSSS